jgi:hypothetical protein
MVNSTSPESVQFLKEISKLSKKANEWIKVKEIKNYQNFLNLEKFGIIAIRNTDEIRILSPSTKELLNKV